MLIGLRSRKHIAPFDIVRPAGIGECLPYLSEGKRAALMAGGLDLIDRMKSGHVFDTIVSLSGIPDLKGIKDSGGSITVGALTTHAAMAEDSLVAERLPDIAKLWREIANPRVRLTGTIGGNLVSALPHYDAMPALLALGATATVAEATSGLRSVSLNDLPGGNALLVNVVIPASSMRLVADRSLHPHVSVYAGAKIASGNVTDLRVAIGGAYARSRVVTVPTEELSQLSLGMRAATIAQRVVEALPEPLTDGFASSRYRLRMIDVLTRRLLVRLGA
ncbi:carbon-monoxide dehydrogenase medium subunit [Pseudorhodoplanes sinuspersici]|nr:carbon-monoxide dehydrogenase medium subunit [Pseudorhodoplanes sinuspersici]